MDESRRGAAFGGILAAFDTGIGTGSIAIGAMAQHLGFAPAFLAAGLFSCLSVPIFIWTEERFPRPPRRHSSEDRQARARPWRDPR